MTDAAENSSEGAAQLQAITALASLDELTPDQAQAAGAARRGASLLTGGAVGSP